MTGIICPSLYERRALDMRALRRAGAAVVVSGMGKLRAMLACFRLAESHPAMSSILLVGFAGALTPELEIGDVIEPHEFIEQDYCAEPFEKFPNRIRVRHPRLVPGSKRAVMLTQDRFLTENPYAGGRRGRYPVACDMESYAVVKFCRERSLRPAVVKLISDTADHSAGDDFLASCRKLAPKLNRTVSSALDRIGRVRR